MHVESGWTIDFSHKTHPRLSVPAGLALVLEVQSSLGSSPSRCLRVFKDEDGCCVRWDDGRLLWLDSSAAIAFTDPESGRVDVRQPGDAHLIPADCGGEGAAMLSLHEASAWASAAIASDPDEVRVLLESEEWGDLLATTDEELHFIRRLTRANTTDAHLLEVTRGALLERRDEWFEPRHIQLGTWPFSGAL